MRIMCLFCCDMHNGIVHVSLLSLALIIQEVSCLLTSRTDPLSSSLSSLPKSRSCCLASILAASKQWDTCCFPLLKWKEVIFNLAGSKRLSHAFLSCFASDSQADQSTQAHPCIWLAWCFWFPGPFDTFAVQHSDLWSCWAVMIASKILSSSWSWSAAAAAQSWTLVSNSFSSSMQSWTAAAGQQLLSEHLLALLWTLACLERRGTCSPSVSKMDPRAAFLAWQCEFKTARSEIWCTADHVLHICAAYWSAILESGAISLGMTESHKMGSDIDTTFVRVWHCMTESKQCTDLQLALHFERG